MDVLSKVNARSLTGGEGADGRRNKEQVQEPMKWKWNGQDQKCQVKYNNKGKAASLLAYLRVLKVCKLRGRRDECFSK